MVEFPFCENLGLRIAGPNPLNLVAFYRRPSSNSRNDSALTDLVRGVSASGGDALLFGDLNAPKIDRQTFFRPSEFAYLLRVLRDFFSFSSCRWPNPFSGGSSFSFGYGLLVKHFHFAFP